MYELSEIMKQEGRILEFSNRVVNNVVLSDEDIEISKTIDAWAKKLGTDGFDEHHDLSAFIRKSISADSVLNPSDFISRIFNESSIGEFDDSRTEKDPENTIDVYENGVAGGNVARSFIDHTIITPTWVDLAAETDVSYVDLRRDGYRTVAKLVNYISEALEAYKLNKIVGLISAGIPVGDAAIAETGALPTETSAKALALRLMDVTDGVRPFAIGINKYMQAIASLTGATTFATDVQKNLYNSTGLLKEYAGMELMSISGVKKLAGKKALLPDKTIMGFSGIVGNAITRGETRVYQTENNAKELTHIKVNGYSFGIEITDISKAAKITMAQ